MNAEESSEADAPAQKNPEPSKSAASPGVADFFRLKAREAEARRRLYAKTDPGFPEFELGLTVFRDATQLANAEGGGDTSLFLMCAAAKLFVRAAVLRERGASSDAAWPAIWARVGELAAWPRASALIGPAGITAVASAVTADDVERHVSTLSREERAALVAALRAVTGQLAGPMEADAAGVRRVVWARRRRIGIAVLALLSATLIAFVSVTSKQNLALHANVAVSDYEPLFPTDPKNVVDGDRTNLGFHAKNKPDTTVTIDLGAVKVVHRIDVYNRADCCQERAVPLSLQLSLDGNVFLTLSRIEAAFEKWTVPFPDGIRARYVRLTHESAQYFHLSEIEVY